MRSRLLLLKRLVGMNLVLVEAERNTSFVAVEIKKNKKEPFEKLLF
jgi:hypothetical protein